MSDSDAMLTSIKTRAIASLSPIQRRTTNLYINESPVHAGDQLGPRFEPVTVERDSILVFVDPYPTADFSHDCEYRLFDTTDGRLYRTVEASWHPYPHRIPEQFVLFHGLVEDARQLSIYRPPDNDVGIQLTASWGFDPGDLNPNRHAILFSGLSNKRHLDEVEFCYRMLIDRYGFVRERIHVLYFDGTLSVHGWRGARAPRWAGDDSDYRIWADKRIVGSGCRSDLQAVLGKIGHLTADALLFLFCTGHGGRRLLEDGQPHQSTLANFSCSQQYFASQLQQDLHSHLGREGSMMVMMQQCFSGGFAEYVLPLANPGKVSFAASTTALDRSESIDSGLLGCFASSWIAAHLGRDAFNQSLMCHVRTGGDGGVQAVEAFRYANTVGVRHKLDEPVEYYSGPGAYELTLMGTV